MAFTLIQYQAICDAIAMGQLIVQYDGKKVQYRSMAELKDARALIADELIATGQLAAPTTAGGVERGGSTYAQFESR